MTAKADTPCVKICKLDPDGAVCIGCGRTLAEIAAWPRATAKERATILIAAAKRPTVKGKIGRGARR